MSIKDVVKKLGLKVICGKELLDREVTGAYAGDLLSDALANSKKGDIWITIQIHKNIVAVASSKELSGIIIVNGRKPARETIDEAEKEGIPLIGGDLFSYDVTGKLYESGIR